MALKTMFSRQTWSLGEVPHVLAVDDSLVDRKIIERLLKIYSCKVTAVDSVKRALQFLEKTSGVDLIITDYSMPGLTGYELLKKIKESSAYRDIPVVIMSSENLVGRIDRCLEEGAEDYIVKPVKLSDMERLKHRLASKQTAPPLIGSKRKQPHQDASSESEACRKLRSLSSPDFTELIA